MRVLLRILKKEFIQTFRDRRMFAIILIAPVLQSIVFGFAVNLDLTAQPLALSDQDRSEESRSLIARIAATDGFLIAGYAATEEEAQHAVRDGRAALALFIPKGYAADLARGRAELLIGLDGSDSNSALRSAQELSQILMSGVIADTRAQLTVRLASQGLSADSGLPTLEVVPRARFNPRLRSAVFTVPGVLCLVLMVITMMLTSMGLTREKEIGTLEQILVTPVRPWQLLLGKILPFALIGLADVWLILCAAAIIFQVPILGSLPEIFFAAGLYLLTTLGLGLFISTVSATQQQAMMNAFFVIMPALMLSGFIFPIENMPEPAQWVTYLNPLRYFVEIMRGLMVKGSSLVDLWGDAASLFGLGFGVLTLAVIRFRKRSG